MFGLIGKMRSTPGQRDELIAILLKGTGSMPGCLNYIVASDPADADASLSLPDVQAAIAKARPIIAGFDSQTRTTPIGGVGL